MATGDLYSSLALAYRIGRSTVQELIPETCDAIWHVLRPIYMPVQSANDWLNIAEDYENTWNFPHCLGAIDGKHIVIKAPRKTGTKFFNYKNAFSIVLLGTCDAQYKFTYVDIGAYGSASDGGVLANSMLGDGLMNKKISFPDARPLKNKISAMPYYFLGDEAFGLKPYLLTPFSGRFLEYSKYYYNKRHTRARRMIENAFGILVARWRIFHTVIESDPKTVEKIVQATVVLHNMLCDSQNKNMNYAPSKMYPIWREEINKSEMKPASSFFNLESGNTATDSIEIRNYLKNYFINLNFDHQI